MVKRSINAGAVMLFAAVLSGYAFGVLSGRAAETASPAIPPDATAEIARGKVLFITYGCGWCHEDGGRQAGKCPKLMNSERDDNFILSRIATGSPGKMPAFGEALKGPDFNALLVYIRSLQPEKNP